nr:MAG TPA: hypothetical protein [Caudoviricetes sp.]
MNNKDLPTMQSIIALVKFLIDTWRTSKCSDNGLCKVCKYNELCAKIDELAKVVGR